MPTSEMSDDELDALARRGAEAYPQEPPPLGAWARMDDKLQAAALNGLVRRKVMQLFALEIAVVLVALLGWQSYQQFVPSSASDVATRTTAPTKLRTTNAEVKSSAAAVASAKPATATTNAVAHTSTIATSVSTTPTTDTESLLKSDNRPNAESKRPLFKTLSLLASSSRRSPTVSQAELADEKQATTTQTSIKSPPAPIADSVAGLLVASLTDSAAHSRQAIAAPVAPEEEAAQLPNLPFYRWTIGLVGGPSVSAVRTEGARLGGDLGLTLDYRFAPRLRVRTALIRSVKRYAALGSDYKSPTDIPTGGPISTVDANCRITEISLDLRYDVVVRPTYSLYVSTGLTTLLMRNERYGYHYDYPSSRPYTITRSQERGSEHLLGMLNLSGGVERAVGERWSVQAEPFLKLPLSGVGLGKMRLQSAGFSFSVKYGLLGRISP